MCVCTYVCCFHDGQVNKLASDVHGTDPDHLDEYLKECVFLPKLNLPSDPSYKENFMAIQDLVLVGGPNDGVISPWQSRYACRPLAIQVG